MANEPSKGLQETPIFYCLSKLKDEQKLKMASIFVDHDVDLNFKNGLG